MLGHIKGSVSAGAAMATFGCSTVVGIGVQVGGAITSSTVDKAASYGTDEPKDWFGGANLIRSKMGMVIQERVRDFRLELKRAEERRAAK